MPNLTGHTRQLIIAELRRRNSGEEPFDFPNQSIKELRALLRGTQSPPMFGIANPADRRKP